MRSRLLLRTAAAARSLPLRCLSSTPTYNNVELSVDAQQHTATVVINRPERHNAFNEHLIAEITQAFLHVHGLAKEGEVRVVLFRGAGKSFSSGADLAWMKKMINYSEQENHDDSLKLFDMFHAIKYCPIPVITQVHGNALGGGAGLVAASDISLGTSTANFGFTEVKLGLIPAVISPFVMRKIGAANCDRYFLTGEVFSAQTALDIGLLHQTFETSEQLEEHAQKLARMIVNNSPRAVRHCKELIREVEGRVITEEPTKHYLASQIAAARVSDEGQEGLSAFFNKQPPSWKV